MTTSDARSLTENALSNLQTALASGQSETLKDYLQAMSRFHRYSWNNVLLIWSQRPQATHVAGFRSWLDLGRFVRRGEKGIVILAPMVSRSREETSEDAPESRAPVFGFRAVHVFDISQTDGEPLPKFSIVSGDPHVYLDRLAKLIGEYGIHIEENAGIAPAHGVSFGGRITLLPDLPPPERFSVLVHEFAHELLHRGDRCSQTNHTMRETEAEAVAYVVGCAVGLETGTSAADYIQLHAGTTEILAGSLSLIQQTAATIVAQLGFDGTIGEG